MMYNILFFVCLFIMLFDLYSAVVYKNELKSIVFFIASTLSVILLNFYDDTNKRIIAVIYVFYFVVYVSERFRRYMTTVTTKEKVKSE